jgi:4-amino-4-deoxy-L-arabinose transferase-like glycosyltransferase
MLAFDAIAVLAIAALLLAAAWYLAHRGLVGPALACLLLLAATIRIYAASERTLHEWDEQFHAVVARHLLAHPLRPTLYDPPLLPYDYRDWTSNYIWLHKPPLTLWLITAAIAMFGQAEPIVRLPSVLFSTLAVGLTFLIGRRIFDDRTALLAAAFQAVNGLLVALVSGRAPTDHVDTILITWVALGVWLALREVERPSIRRQAALGVVVGLGFLTKTYPALLVLPVWLVLALAQPSTIVRRACWIGGAAVLVAAPWIIYSATMYPAEFAWEWRQGFAHAVTAIDDRGGGAGYYIADMPKFFGELVFLPVVWFLLTALKAPRLAAVALTLWATIPYAVFSLSSTKMPAYVMIAAPAIFLMEASACIRLVDRASPLPRAIRLALLVMLLGLPARYLLRPGGPFTIDRSRPGWVTNLVALEPEITARRAVLFNVAHPVAAMFYLPWPVYPRMPTASDRQTLAAAGYTVLIFDPATGTVRETWPEGVPADADRR